MNVQVLYLVSAVLVISFPGLNSSVINCGFEDENLCGYVQDPTLESFTRRSGPSTRRSSGSGPATSVEGQWYMYIKGLMSTRAFARLESLEERPVFKKCLRFSYHMYGDSIWLLKVYIKTSEGLDEAIWMKTRNQGDMWYTATVEVTSFQPFRVVFEAHAGDNINCEIAIDDVKLVNCSSTACNVSTTDGGCCVFPFTYGGVVYQSCTTIKNNNVLWCSKTTNYVGQWGNCMPAANVPDTGVSLEPWAPWKKCDQTCGSNYRARVRFWYSAELDKSFNFTYHVRYSTSDQLCPEERRWYFDNLEDGSFGDEYGKHNAVVVSGAMNSDDRMLIVKENQDSVEISFQEGSCIFGGTSCDDGFTLSYWIYLQTQQGISSILSSSSKWKKGLRVTISDLGTVNVTMETKDKKWVINSDITQAKWIYVSLTWSECFGLTYYENGDIKEYSGIFDTKEVLDSGGLTLNDVNDILFIGKSPFAGGALFSMTELVIWRGQLSPADIKLLSHKVDGIAKFGFLKPGDESFFEWSKGYASTPSEDTGPSFTHLRNEFDIDQEDYKPSSCNDIKYKRNGISDGYYVIYPRGSCGDALKVYCADMDGSSPEEYIDVDPDQNYAYYAGLEQPCGSSWIESGVTNFTKVRLYPDDMKVGVTSFKFATIEGEKHIYGSGGACYSGADSTCVNSGHFKINLRETGLRVKPTVKWKGDGYALNYEIMVNYIRSFDGQEISASCGGLCGWCIVDGALVFEQVSCVKKKPRSCLDVKVYHGITEDGDFIIYPISTGLLPLRVFCVDMATTTPKEYVNVTSSDSKNYALYSKDVAAPYTCVLSSTTPFPAIYVNTQGLTRFSKVRLNVDDEMYIMNADYHFAELVFGIHHPLGWASSCFSWKACLPRGLFNIDLTGTGIGVRSTVAWTKRGWPNHWPPNLFKVQRGVFGELIDGNCGAYCGSCFPSGSLFVDLVVSHERKNWRYFGKQNTSLMETTDRGQNDRVFGLSTVCSVAVGCQSGAIPDQAFAASSINTGSNTFHARLNHATLRGWAPLITDVDPWLSIDLLSVRLVTAIATQGDSSANYVKTYLLSYGFDGLQWLTYSNIFKLPLVFQGNGDASGVIKRDLVKPMFAKYVRFHPLTWSTSPTLRVEIYVCPRASYHHMVTSGDYFFVESSYPRNKGERSELVTRVMLPIYQCIHFWFHMTGTNMGRLDVYVEEMSNDKTLTWSVFGDRGKLYWQKAAIPLAINTTFRVYIVGVVGDGCKSDMAVAGLSFTTDGNCSFSPSYASPEAGTSCFGQCVGTDCDPITGKCICQNKDYVGETCKNELVETLYEDAFHYWSFDNAEITDLKTGSLAQGTTERVPGPVNQAVHIKSNIHFRESILVSCLADPSSCSSGLTITLWLKHQIGQRSRFFLTSESDQLGIKVACFEGSRWVTLKIQGSSHECSCSILVPVDIWSFVCFTWSISADGTGEIIAYYNGVTQAKSTCRSESRSFSHNRNKMKADVKSPTSYSMDELVVWNHTLSATKVMQIYDNITRNPDYSIVLTFRLESYRWHRAFGDEESEEWREAREHIAKAVSVGDKNTTQVKRIWAEFEVDECIYPGSVINGDASWHENSILRCDDNRFGVKQELFQLELTVNSSGARVRLNNIDLGSVGGNLSSTARGGFFASTDPDDTTVLVKDYGLKPAGNSSLFTYDDCDMSRSGKFGGQYALFGQQVSTSTHHCMAIRRDTLFSGSYSVEAQLYHVSGNFYGGEEAGHMGILFNYKNRKNFIFFILRPFTTSRCYEVSRFENGVNTMLVAGKCPTGSRPTYRTWHALFLVVRPTFIKAYLSGVLLVHHHNNFHAHAVKVGVLVYANANIDIRFKDFVVVKEDHFELLSNFADSRSFSLPSSSNGVRNHAILSMVETTGSPTNVYSVSADFQFAKSDSYSVPGTSTGGFGISFNVMDEQNFDFVYYRRNRIVFADVAQMVADVSWQENEILKEKLESSSLILINKSSTKVPTHIPFNVSSVALNSTALNVSWHWDPDNDVTGLFQGFKVLYRQEDDGEESWVVRIILGREFERFSPVAVTNLRKGTGYFVKLVAFSLVGDGWPSEEIFNSTHDDVPDIVDLNVTLRNIDLQIVFVQWERLPKYFRNGQLLGYIVTFQELGIAGAQLAKNLTVYGEESNTTLRELKHFTNYSVTVMAFNNIGVSLPTNAVVIETIEFVPAIYPPNVSATVLNSSALTVSWDPIDKFLWQGLSLGYVVYISSSGKDLYNITVPSNTLELTITNLTAFTMYNVTVVAYTRKGLGPKSPMIRKRTEEEIPSIPPVNIRIQSNQSSELINSSSSRNVVATSYSTTIEWDPVPKEKVRGVIRGYKVTYQPVEVYYITRAYLALSSHLNPVTKNSNTSSIRLDDLLFLTNYSAHVMAYTVGDGIAGSFHFMTPEGVPAISPPNVSATVLNTSALAVSWDPIDGFLWQGLSLGYVVYISSSGKDLYNITVPSNTLELTITNLTAFTMYNMTVVAYTRKGLGPKSPMIGKRTEEEIPSIPPVNIRIQSNQSSELINSSSSSNIVATSYSTTIEWDPVPEEKVRGVIRGYKVTYQPVEIYYITRARRALSSHLNPVTQNSSTSSIRLDDLLFFTNYSAHVMAYTVGDGIAGSFHFMTPEGAPSESPPNLRASHDGSKSSLSVKWDSIPLYSRNGILKGYHIYYKESSTSDPMMNITLAPDVTQVLLNDLQTFTAYDIHVCGFTIAGDGVRGIITQRTRSYDLAPYTAPWDVSTTLSSPLSVLLTWIPFPESHWRDNPRGYVITFQRVALGGAKISGDPIRRITVGYTAGSYLWSDLTYYTEYKIEISTITYRGYGPKVILYAGTCNCPSHMTTTFRLFPPYVLKTHGAMRGILPDLIRQMTSSCCVPCSTFSATQIDFKSDGHGNMAIKDSHPALVASLNQETTFAFPIYGYLDQTHYYASYGFIPGVQSPGMVAILKRKSPGNLALAVLSSIFGIWPILIISVLLASIAGVIMWMLDSYSNEEIFPRTCIRGCLEGFWWAYISMTTVGYGDTTAKSVPARIFAVIWVLLGLCVTSILIGDLCSSLSVTVSVSESTLYGAKVAALVNSTEESVAIRRCAKLVGGPYLTLQQMQEALLDGEVDIVILDVYVAGLSKQLWNHTDLRISKVLNYPSTYGVVFSGDTYGVQHCFRKYIHDNQGRIMELMEKYTETLSSVKTESATEYVQDLIDVQSSSFHYALLTISFSLAAAFLLGTLWNFACKRRRSTTMKKENSVHPVEITKEILCKDLEHFCSRMSQCLETMKRRHGKEIRTLRSLKERFRLRHALNCCRTKVTAAS